MSDEEKPTKATVEPLWTTLDKDGVGREQQLRIEKLEKRLLLMSHLANAGLAHADMTFVRRTHEEGSAGE